MYEKLTDSRAKDIDNLVEKENIPIDAIMKKIDKIETEIKFAAFGKTRINNNKAKQKSVINKVSENDEDLDRKLIMKQSQKVENEILKLKSQNLGRVGNVFKMREVINGPKKSSQGPTAIRDPKSNELIVSNEAIKDVTLAYCVDNLTHKSEEKSTNKGLELKKYLHDRRMEESDEEGFEINRDDFDKVVGKFGKKKTKSYDFLIKSGKHYKDSVYKVCKQMIGKEEF